MHTRSVLGSVKQSAFKKNGGLPAAEIRSGDDGQERRPACCLRCGRKPQGRAMAVRSERS
jgi:hypothetical protein